MKVTLQFSSDGKPELVIHSENDMETMALQSWSEKYFTQDEIKRSDAKAYLLIYVNMENKE